VAEPEPERGRHEVMIVDRERVTVNGVVHVETFDDQEVVLDTDLGILVVRGEDLHIQQLDLERGSFGVEGLVSAVEYSAPGRDRGFGAKGKAKGLLGKLLK